MVEPIRSNSLAAEAFERVTAAITSGEFEPGQKLSEVELARQLGISRGPVREALNQLEGRLVTRTPRVGVRVIQFGHEELQQLFHIREAIEGMAARLAAECAGDEELRAIEGLLKQHADKIAHSDKSIYRQGTGDEDFHIAVARASRSDRLEKLLLSEVYFHLRIHRLKSSTKPGRAEQALAEHKEIVTALLSRDGDRAEAAMRNHVRNAWKSMQSLSSRVEA